jgi:hypothetical protein
MIDINGEMLSEHETEQLIKMLLNDAKRMAGEFHNMNRSEKFRANWPDEYKFADLEWRNFVDATIKLYAELLGKTETSEYLKGRMHKAIVLWAHISGEMPKDNRIQLQPGTLQFEGDPYENKKILETYGKGQNLRAALLNSAATRH